jgi:hypothetical protein
MKSKILAELVKKFPGLSKVLLGLIADQLAEKVTEESGIDQAITDFDNAVSIKKLATEFQKEGDRRVTDAKKEWDKKNTKPADDDTDDDDDQDDDQNKAKSKKDKKPKSDEPPSWAKGLIETVQKLTKEKVQSSILEQARAKLKGVPEKFWNKRTLPEKDEDLETFVAEIEADWKELKQDDNNLGFESQTTPVNGVTTDANSSVIKSDIDKAMGKIAPKKK